MPFVELDGSRHYYRLDGADDRPVVIFSHSLGLDHAMWDVQAADCLPHLRVLRYDTRGHGSSDAPPGDYTVAALGRDLLGIADAAGVGRFAFVGLSLGGMIGQWLGAHAADRLTHLVLANTTARVADPAAMDARRTAVLEHGLPAVVNQVMARFFSPETLAANGAVVATARRTLLATSAVGYAGCCAAIRDMDHEVTAATIRTPTLVIGGTRDVSMPWDAHGRVLADIIPSACALQLPAAHLSNLERPRSFSAALLELLLTRADGSVAVGMPIRRAVLGDAHVDRSLAGATALTREFQELITRTAWGTIWARPGLDWRSRRLLVLAMTAARGNWEEFRLHVRSGLAAELEECDIEEVLLQVAVYAGVPAANTGFQIAAEEIAAVATPDAGG